MSAFRLGENPQREGEPSAEDEMSRQREGEPSAADEKSRQREGEPSADIQSPQRIFRTISNFLSNQLLAGPLNLSSQALVERLPHHCRIV